MELNSPKMPVEAVRLYNLFIHGDISRRDFMDGLQKVATASLAVGVMVEALMPNYAAGQQIAPTDNRIKATYETIPSPNGNGTIKGYFVRPISADTRNAMPSKLPGILVVHENRGLNPHIEDVARRFTMAIFWPSLRTASPHSAASPAMTTRVARCSARWTARRWPKTWSPPRFG